MDEELTPEQKFAAESAETKVPREILAGRSPDAIIADLVRLDWRPEAARAMVERVASDLKRYYESPESRRALVREARFQWIGGCVTIVVGIPLLFVATLVRLRMLTFSVAFAFIFSGLVFMGRGWARWRLYRQVELRFPQAPIRRSDEAQVPSREIQTRRRHRRRQDGDGAEGQP